MPIGSTVRAEILDAMYEPSGFRIWRSIGRLSKLFAPVRPPRPVLTLKVAGWESGIVYSEEFNTGAALGSQAERYEFDPNTDAPRSPELVVVPHTSIERSGGRRAVWSTEVGVGSIPAKAGTKLEFGYDGSTRVTYDLTAAVDPLLQVRVLVPWGGDEHDLGQYFADRLAADAASLYSTDPTGFRAAARDFYRALAPDLHEGSPAELVLDRGQLLMGAGEQAQLTLTASVRRPGIGLFAIEVVDFEGRTSESDPFLYEIPADRSALVLYDAVVRFAYEERDSEELATLSSGAASSLSIPTDGVVLDAELPVSEDDAQPRASEGDSMSAET